MLRVVSTLPSPGTEPEEEVTYEMSSRARLTTDCLLQAVSGGELDYKGKQC